MPGNAVAVATQDHKGTEFTIVRAQWRQLPGDAVARAGCSQAAVAELWERKPNLLPHQLDINSVQGPWGTLKEKLQASQCAG